MRFSLLALAILAPLGFSQQLVYDSSVIPNQNLWTDGVTLADIDGDGDLDVLFANGSGYDTNGGALQQKLYTNNAGIFSGNHGNLNVANFNAKQVIAEDFDGDGDLDLMYAQMGDWPNPIGTPILLINQGGDQGGTEGVFADVTATNMPSIRLVSFGLCAGDVDNDGDQDVVVTDGGTFGGVATQQYLYLNNGSGVFTDATASRMPVDNYNAQDVILLDYDGDFDIDIALSGKGQSGKRARLYLNDGSGHFSISPALNNVGSGATYEIDWGDLDGDGDFDAAVQSISGQSEGWARNVGPTTAMTKTTFPSPNGNDDNEMALFDYDNDGDLDAFVAHLGSPEKSYNNNNAVFTRSDVASGNNDSTLDFAFGDLDGDGRIDMVTANGEGTGFRNKAYMNNGAADSIAPLMLALRNPASITQPETLFYVQVRDSVSDDGQINATVSYTYTTDDGSGGTAGSGDAVDMGTGLFRAAVPSHIGTTSVSLIFTATDHNSNSAVSATQVVNVRVVQSIGGGLTGVSGVPLLSGSGMLYPGMAGSFELTGADTSSLCALFIGLGNSPIPFLGGFLLTNPFAPPIFLFTSPSGTLSLPFASWPTGLPAGFQFWLQVAVDDAVALGGASISNAVEVTVP
jgi:hypothetical protein